MSWRRRNRPQPDAGIHHHGQTNLVRIIESQGRIRLVCARIQRRSEIRPLSGAFRKRTSLRNPADRTRILAHARGIRSQASQHQLLLLKLTAIHKQSPSFISEDGDCFSYIYVACLRLFLYRRYSIACSAINISQSIFRNQEASPMLYFNVITRIADCVTLSAKAESAAAFAFSPSKIG